MLHLRVVRSLCLAFVNRALDLQIRKIQKSSSMSSPKRYFINALQDYQGDGNSFVERNWNSKIHEIVNVIIEKQKPSVKDADGGLYVGIAGIGYMFCHMSLSPTFAGERSKLIEKGLEYIEPALEYAERQKNDKSQKSAFLLGNAGIYAVAAALYHALGMLELAMLIYLNSIDPLFPEPLLHHAMMIKSV